MTTARLPGFWTHEAALRAIMGRMEQHPDYRPRRYLPGEAGVLQARSHVADVEALVMNYQTEGDS